MKLEDIIHHYLGCEVMVRGEVKKFAAIDTSMGRVEIEGTITDEESGFYGEDESESFPFKELSQVKPILRKLEDMTEEEYDDLCFIREASFKENDTLLRKAACTTYLLSKGFDVHQLIENNQAIDKSTLGG
jgi:hypothetical protein